MDKKRKGKQWEKVFTTIVMVSHGMPSHNGSLSRDKKLENLPNFAYENSLTVFFHMHNLTIFMKLQ